MPILNAAWEAKVARLGAFMTQEGPRHSLRPEPISTLGGWHTEARRAILSIASGIASRAMAGFGTFQRHGAHLATKNGSCHLSGCVASV